MAKQTINIGASPNDGTGTPLRTSFDYCNQNFTELYTATGPSGNNIVVPGNATITGDLTVRTAGLTVNANGVGVGVVGTLGAGNIQIGAGKYLGYSANSYITPEDNVQGARIKTSGNITLEANAATNFSIGGSTAMTLNSTGLGVGVVPSTYKLEVGNGSVDARALFKSNNAFSIGVQNGASGIGGWIGSTGNNILTFSGNDGTMKVTISDSGNVGVGVTPSAWLSGYKALQINATTNLFGTGTASWLTNNWTVNAAGSNTYQLGSSTAATAYFQGSGVHYWFNAAAGTGTISSPIQAMTLDASGRLFIGKTSSSAANTGCELQTGTGGNAASVLTADGAFASIMNRLTSDGIIVDLRRQTLSVGNISVTTTGATFNSTSDYRLKESVSPLSGGLARVNALKPSVYKWKSNGSDGEGFLAHELAEVVPAAVNGEKDAVNDDGTIKAQSIDMSRVVPILVAAIKELTARVEALEA